MTPAGIEPATFQFVAQHLNHGATAVPHLVGFTIDICYDARPYEHQICGLSSYYTFLSYSWSVMAISESSV